MRGLLITGTDTAVGKTHVACAIIRDLRDVGHRVGAFKPVVSGAVSDENGRLIWEDVEALKSALGEGVSEDRIAPLRFAAALAPPIAARQEGRNVNLELIRSGLAGWRSQCDVVVVEGAGGLLCPLTDDKTMADLAVEFSFPLLIVARLGLGTINHTLLTVEAARTRGLRIAGIVLNEASPISTDDLSALSNADEIVKRSNVPVVAMRRHNHTGWFSRFSEPVQIDWWSLSGEA